MILPPHFQRRIRRHLLARFLDLPLAREDQPRQDQRLRLGPAVREAAIDEELIGSEFHSSTLVIWISSDLFTRRRKGREGAKAPVEFLPMSRHWEEQSDEAIQKVDRSTGLLRFARHDERGVGITGFRAVQVKAS